METRYGFGFVAKLNLLLKTRTWDDGMFEELTGHNVNDLWTEYKEHLGSGKKLESDTESAPPPVPTHARPLVRASL